MVFRRENGKGIQAPELLYRFAGGDLVETEERHLVLKLSIVKQSWVQVPFIPLNTFVTINEPHNFFDPHFLHL